MIIIMQSSAIPEMIDHVANHLKNQGLKVEILRGETHTAIAVIGRPKIEKGNLTRLPGVKEILTISKPYQKVTRDYQTEKTLVQVGTVSFGLSQPVMIAGPCAVESEEQIFSIARAVKQSGADMLRGGAFKPRTSPHSFQGLGVQGLKLLRKAGNEIGLPVVTEITSTEHLDSFLQYADMLQVGARNMQNFDLLKTLSKIKKPILLKRGMNATMEEFLLAAEYLLEGGNDQVVLCERGIRPAYSDKTILDLNTLILIKELSHLPIIVDPSHAAGRYDLVIPLARAGLAAGADGVMLEVHHKPEEAFCDGKQALTLEMFDQFMKTVR